MTIAYSDEQAKEQISIWEQRAKAVPGARVGMMRMPDPIGGASFYIYTDSIELAKQAKWPTIEEIRARCSSPEDADALKTVELILGGENERDGMFPRD